MSRSCSAAQRTRSNGTRAIAAVAAFVAAAAFASPSSAQVPPGAVPLTAPVNQTAGSGAATTGNFFENTRGNLVRHQLSHTSPVALDAAIGDYLFAPNNAGQRVSITYVPTNSLVAEIPTGPGITALKNRPTTNEAWAVDSINGCVTVIDPLTLRIVRTIAVGKEPHGLAFLADGSRAYVTCSAGCSVDVIDCAGYTVAKTIALPNAVAPRGIAIQGSTVWVVPFYSGNGTVAKRVLASSGDAGSQQVVTPATALGELPLPDEDLFAIQVTASAATDFLDASRTQTGLGTILFNVHAHPSKNELWIPNTDAQNLIVGEPNFVGGQVVSNRITIVDAGSGAATVLDLDAMALALNMGGAAQPVAVEFDAAQDRAYVALFGSDAVFVVDTSAAQPSAYTLVDRHALTPLTPPLPAGGATPTATPARCGPRGMVLRPGGNELIVFNGIDNSFSKVDLTVAGSTAPQAVTIGFDPTPASVKRGLGHLANADHSASGTSSCMSCHVDGHFDMLMWDLSAFMDPAGTASPQFEVDDKGPMATQSLRSLFAAGPLHWRGERAQLADFNQGGFVGLLKRATPLTPEQFAEVEAGTFSLVYPSNPRQPADRVHAGLAATGLDAFRRTPAIGGDSCASCHQLPLGTSAELQALFTTARPARSAKVAHLRGTGDKMSPVVPVFATAPGYASSFKGRTTNGWGLSHGGTVESIARFVGVFPGVNGTLPPLFVNRIAEISAFVDQFDTGLAPSTAFQRTLSPGSNSATDWNTLLTTTVIPQRTAGNCDFVVAGAVQAGAQFVVFSLAWDHQQQAWQTGINGATFTDAQVHQFTLANGVPITVFGMPLGTGWRFGVDRDLDGLFNDSETAWLPFVPADVWNPDSDGDGFPDGHEVVNGRHPRIAQGTGTPDVAPPQIVAGPTVVFFTMNTAKIEFTTNEPARAEVVNGIAATRSPADGRFDVNHSIYVRELLDGATTNVALRLTDAVNNSTPTNVVVPVTTLATTVPDARVAGLKVIGVSLPQITVRANVGSSRFPASSAVGAGVELFAYADAPGVPLTHVTQSTTNTVVSGNTVDFVLTIPVNVLAGTPGQRRLHFGVRNITSTTLTYIEGLDVLDFRTATF